MFVPKMSQSFEFMRLRTQTKLGLKSSLSMITPKVSSNVNAFGVFVSSNFEMRSPTSRLSAKIMSMQSFSCNLLITPTISATLSSNLNSCELTTSSLIYFFAVANISLA